MATTKIKPKLTAAEHFKINLERRFVSPARNNNLWEAFTEFKQKTEDDEIFANSIKSPEQKKEMNKVILDAFSKIDTSKTNYKYYNTMAKLKNRFQNNLNLFSNSNLESKKDPFMDNVMQEIINRDISFLKETDMQQFRVLFYILENSNFKTQSEKFKALDDLNKNVFYDNSDKGKFTSIKVADKFKHLNELCKRISNFQTFLISSTAANTPGLSFDEALAKFRSDLKKNCIPTFEVANMYNSSLGIKPLDIAKFINKQEELFVSNFKQKNPNIEINYSKPNLSKIYPFVKFSENNSPKLTSVPYVKKSAIYENIKRVKYTIKDLSKDASKISKLITSHTNQFRKSKTSDSKNKLNNLDNKPKAIIKSSKDRDL